jgi:hypothetical protein
MKNLNKFSKYILYIMCISGAVWLGSYITRLFVTYHIFQGNDFILREYITQQNLNEIFFTLKPAFLTSLILYTVFFVSFIVFLSTAKIKLKHNGWFFITTIIIFFTFPFEAYLMNIDYKIVMLLSGNGYNRSKILNLIIERFKVFGSFPLVEIFCYFAIIFLIIFQPLTKNIALENK